MEDISDPKNEMIEEISSIISLLLSDTRRYLGGEISRKSYDKIGFINTKLNEIDDLFKAYRAKRVDRSYVNKIRKIIEPLNKINEETPVVEVEKILMVVTKALMVEQGYNQETPDVNEDDIIGAREKLFNAFKAVPTDNYGILKGVVKKQDNEDYSNSTEEKTIRIDYMKKIHDQFKATRPGGDFHDYLNGNYAADFNDLWDTKYEALEKQDIINAQKREREDLMHLREAFRVRALKAFTR